MDDCNPALEKIRRLRDKLRLQGELRKAGKLVTDVMMGESANRLAVQLDHLARHASAAASLLRQGLYSQGSMHALAVQGTARRVDPMLLDLAEKYIGRDD